MMMMLGSIILIKNGLDQKACSDSRESQCKDTENTNTVLHKMMMMMMMMMSWVVFTNMVKFVVPRAMTVELLLVITKTKFVHYNDKQGSFFCKLCSLDIVPIWGHDS